jgi:hypothetical protein
MQARFVRLVWTLVGALVGFPVGCVTGVVGRLIPESANYPFLAENAPLPHHVPQYQSGLSFRFAMAHDVIHERFPRHGAAHYRERNRLTREKLAMLSPDDPASFPLADDLAAGLERLGQPDEAVAVMRDKLARQQAKGLTGRDLYTSSANLGTFLIHAGAPKAVTGDAAAKERFREGVGLVRKSVEVNPEAHFGRERWQVVIAKFLLAAVDKPDLLKKFDCLGNRLDLEIEEILRRESNWMEKSYGRSADFRFHNGNGAHDVPAFFHPGVRTDDPASWPELNRIRRYLTRVGAEEGWEEVALPSHQEPAPFDEPMLGIIGMWRQGGGANPHFALAMGETMLRVGQRYIAWTAFERASRMAERFRPDPALQQFLRDHCRKRQEQIEQTLLFQAPADAGRPWQHIILPPSPGTVAGLRSAFEAELAHGQGYQRAYQQYEEEKIKAGVPTTDEHFFDEFLAGREPISSPLGPEEWFVFVPLEKLSAYRSRWIWVWSVLGSGLAAMMAALLSRWVSRHRPEGTLVERTGGSPPVLGEHP